MTEITKEANFLDKDEESRIVRLHGSYGFDISELYTRMKPLEVTITWTSSRRKPKRVSFEAYELDLISEAWDQYKLDRQAALDAEVVRQQRVLAEAYTLAHAMEGIEIDEKDDIPGNWQDYHGWEVRASGMSRVYHYSTPDATLQGVKDAIGAWMEFLLDTQDQLEHHQKEAREGNEQQWLVNRIKFEQEIISQYGHLLEQESPAQ